MIFQQIREITAILDAIKTKKKYDDKLTKKER